MTKTDRKTTIDFLKGMAIIFILILHFSWSEKERLFLFLPYWAEMAVPIFMTVSGYVWTLSFEKRKVQRLSEGYRPHLLAERFIRFTIPFIVAYLIELLYIVFINKESMTFSRAALMFITGGIGQGSYYFPILIQLIFVFPLIFVLIKRFDLGGLAGVFLFSAVYELLARLLNMSPEVYRLLIPRYVFIIAAGSYVCIGKKIIPLYFKLIMTALGGIFITLVCMMGHDPFIMDKVWAGTSYIAVLWMLPFTDFLLRKNIHIGFVEILGKASYNIFLAQLVIYTYGSWIIEKFIHLRFLQFIVLFAIIIGAGILFYLTESKITGKLISKIRR